MVVAVEVQSLDHPSSADTSLISIRIEDPDPNDFEEAVILMNHNNTSHGARSSSSSFRGTGGGGVGVDARDTSQTSRSSLRMQHDNTRLSVNTHNSILNITEDDDDDDDDSDDDEARLDKSFLLFEDMAQDPLDTSLLAGLEDDVSHTENDDDDGIVLLEEDDAPATPPFSRSKCCVVVVVDTPTPQDDYDDTGSSRSNKRKNRKKKKPTKEVAHRANVSLFDLPERFAQSLCFGNNNTNATPKKNKDSQGVAAPPSTPLAEKCAASYRRLLEEDIFELLGCAASPDAKEMEHVWTMMHKHSLFCSGANSSSNSNRGSPLASAAARRRPRRKSLAQRALRVHRLRSERCLPHKRTGLAVVPSLQSQCSPTSVTNMMTSNRMMLQQHRSRSLNDDYATTRKQLFHNDNYYDNNNHNNKDSNNDDLHHFRLSCNGDETNIARSYSGYDSDPGEFHFGLPPPPDTFPLTTPMPCHLDFDDDNDNDINRHISGGSDGLPRNVHQVVQESLNLTWTLTWHPNRTNILNDNTADATTTTTPPTSNPSLHSNYLLPQAVCCNVWIERGTMVHNNTTMLEPNLMWRQAYQPPGGRGGSSRNKLAHGYSIKPFSIRLLNLCRIVSGFTSSAAAGNNNNNSLLHKNNTDSNLLQLALRPSCCFVIQTADAGDYLFEAASPRHCQDVVRRLKLIVARFATLAILEDMDGIVQEFFSTAATNNSAGGGGVPGCGGSNDHHVKTNNLLIPHDDDDDDDNDSYE